MTNFNAQLGDRMPRQTIWRSWKGKLGFPSGTSCPGRPVSKRLGKLIVRKERDFWEAG